MKHHFRKSVSALLALSMMAATVAGTMSTVYAGGDTLPPREGEQGYKGENQPVYHGHRATDILNWTPETDEFSDFMRAQVPLQERNEAFAATQANPQLDQEVASLALSEDYGNEFFNPDPYNDLFSQNVFNFWQYLDYRAAWHGTVTNPTPDSLLDPEAPWNERAYEFGVLNIPNPAYTNAAHKNGVQSLGCIFFPRTEHTDDFVYQDENGRFPMADKFVEIAKYYGFDGYFINAEETLPADFMPVYEEFCRAMTSQGLYIQTYASNKYGQNNQDSWGRIDYYNKDATQFSNWIKGPEDETIAANSLYMNPDPSKAHVDGSVSTMESLGLDARQTVFNTLEAGQTGFSGTRGSLYNLYDENLVPRTGIANLGVGTVWAHLDEQLFGHSGNNSYEEYRRGDPDYQKYVFARERAWWAGSLDAPTYAGGKGTLESASLSHEELLDAVLNATFDPVAVANNPDRGKPNEGQGYQTWRGMSAFISERSVVDGTNFYTNFNTGHGMQYFVDGQVSNDHEWANINIQDILPTWQWWIDTESQNRLTLDFDYGEKYSAAYDYTQVGGYDGGSSLAIFGDVDAKSDIRLYKTNLSVTDTTQLNMVYNKPSTTDDSTLSAVLYFQDGDTVRPVYVPIENANVQTDGWVSASLDLSDYAGETIAAFGLSVDTNGAAVQDYQINIGEMTITDKTLSTPAAPTGLTIDKAFDTSEVYISWDLADYSDVQKYNVYAEFEDGTEMYMGGTYDDVFYIKSLYEPKGNVTIKVTAEGADGQESEAATVTRNFDEISSGLTVEEGPGVLNASWTNPDMDYASIRAEVTLPYNYAGNTNTYSAEFEKDAVSGSVLVPIADGSNYTFRLSHLDEEGNVITSTDCSGQLKDLYCDAYEGSISKSIVPGKGWKLQNPEAYDWWHLTAWYNGEVVKDNVTRGVDDLTGLKLEGDFGYVEVQLEDFNGNKSEITRVYYGLEDKAVDETIFPDPVLLEAVKTQVGETMDKVIAFNGTLDLSGLDIKDFTGLSYLENLTGIDFTNSPATIISGLDVLKNLKEVTLTGCAQLQILDLSNTTVETISCDDPSALQALASVNLSGARLDLSKGTPEQQFVEAAKVITAGKEDVTVIGPEEEVNFAPEATVIEGDPKMFDGDDKNYASSVVNVLDFGEPTTISKWELVNYMYPVYGVEEFTLYASDNGTDFEEILVYTGAKANTVTGTLDQPVTARYFKLQLGKAYISGRFVKDFKLVGPYHSETVYEAGVACNDQRPACYETIPETVSYQRGTGVIDPAGIPIYKTVRGNDFASLADADFIAEDYDIAAQMESTYDVIYVDGSANTTIARDQEGTHTVSYVTFGEETVQRDVTVYIKGVTSVLEKVAAKAEQMKADGALDNTMEAVVTEFNAALQAAKDLLAQEDASQADLDAAAVRLLKVMAKVDWKQGDKTILEVAVDVANSINENLDLYVEEGKQEFIDALANAQALLESGNAWQDDIDAATDALIEAMSNLRMKPNKDILNDMIDQASGLDLDAYTADSVAALNAALANAQAVAADENATQDEVDAVADTLQAALNGLIFVDGTNGTANGGNGATTPVGDGSKPTKTGDAGAAGLAALAVLSVGAILVLKKKER